MKVKIFLIMCIVFLFQITLEGREKELFSFKKTHKDSLIVEFSIRNDTIFIHLNNNGADTLYVFSTYFENRDYANRYLLRYDLKEKKYKMSFTPLLSTISTVLSDKIILSDEYLLAQYQSKWHFKSIAPKDTILFKFDKTKIRDLFKSLEKITVDKTVSFDRKIKKIKKSKLPLIDYLWFEFSVYQQINLLMEKGSELRSPNKYMKEASSFRIYSIAIPSWF